MAEPNEDQLASEREEIIRWHVAMHADSYVETVERWAETEKKKALTIMTDMTLPEAERNKNAGKYELADELSMKRALSEHAYESLKQFDAEQVDAEQAQGKSEETVGSKADDQWYEQ